MLTEGKIRGVTTASLGNGDGLRPIKPPPSPMVEGKIRRGGIMPPATTPRPDVTIYG